MSSCAQGRGRRFAGGGLVVAALVSVQLGYAIATGRPPLETSSVMMAAGSVTLVLWVAARGGLRVRGFDRAMRRLVLRLAFGNTVVSFAYLYAQQRLTLGTAASVTVVGMLSVGLAEVWRARRTAWGAWHLLWRGVAFGGVLALNEPWRGGSDGPGMLWAAASAWCVWNVPTTIRRMAARGRADQGAALANLLTAPVLAVLVPVTGGGLGIWTSPEPLALAGAAGVLTVTVPVLLQNAALRRVAARDLAVVQSLNPAVAALVAQAGVLAGQLDPTQRTTPAGWIAISVIIAASAGDSLVAPRPGDGGHHESGAPRR
ncbi:EamA family transporter [Actinomadura verrucosospora]|uniref:Drug/metabolite transporter permease n=1 Tax=Actinomadura verrucosospora TaxID=46165 RepID=A0A7D4A1D7_ACTVE|nr:EamA family transporter [Actinomadura verrucosospora]QKG23344.1 drug/metabolite transporter permease [Actinomadura verrucosospora]